MSLALALLPSPFLGPAVWQPAAEALAARGQRVVMARAPREAPHAPEDVVRHFLAALPEDDELVLVLHSNAGLYAPQLAMRLAVRAYVFVDALVPPSTGSVPVAPPALLERLRVKADADGVLPPWTTWWDEADVAPLFGSAGARRAVTNEQLGIPLSYVEGSVAIPPGWDERPGAYLGFGDTYAEHRARAERRGWPVATMDGGHLHMLVEPAHVADQILSLVTATGVVGLA